MLPWFGVVVKKDIDPEKIASYRAGGFTGVEPEKRLVPKPTPGIVLATPPFAPNGQRPALVQPVTADKAEAIKVLLDRKAQKN